MTFSHRQPLPLAVQLYSVRRETALDPWGTLQKIAALGFESIELAGDYGWPVERWREALAETGLKILGAHVSLAELRGDYEKTTAFHQALGTPWIVIPYSEEDRSPTGWRRLAEELNEWGGQLQAGGFQLAYHHHDFEIVALDDGKCGLEILFEVTQPAKVAFEIDTYWVHQGGRDARQFIEQYQGRIGLLHAKEWRFSDGADVPAGEGNIDFPGILALAKEHSWPVIVEFEGENALPAVEASATYLRRLL